MYNLKTYNCILMFILQIIMNVNSLFHLISKTVTFIISQSDICLIKKNIYKCNYAKIIL